ncbi:MAG: PBS lyase [Alteromonadaceae bacterium]|nr:PBS lyase [Alteromonadaceae bacterium]
MGLRKSRGESASQADRRKNSRDLASLIDDLQASCAEVRRWAARDLTNNLAARTALLEQIDIEHEPTVLEALFSAVEGMCDEEMAGALLEKLKSEDAQVRNGAIELLQSQPVLFAAHVNELLCDEDSDVRIFAVDVIGAIRHPDAATWLHNVVLNDNNINVVGTAVDKLSEIGDSGTLEVLEKVSARFPGEAYIQFAIQCVRDSVAGEGV